MNELKKKTRYLINRGWYVSTTGLYCHQACYTLSRSLEEIDAMSWDDIRSLEAKMRQYLVENNKSKELAK